VRLTRETSRHPTALSGDQLADGRTGRYPDAPAAVHRMGRRPPSSASGSRRTFPPVNSLWLPVDALAVLCGLGLLQRDRSRGR
jgi:hypothetical protein